MGEQAARWDLNPLARNSKLFQGYMGLLDDVLGQEEIRAALADQNLSSTQVRMRCSAASASVLREAAPEYAAYEAAVTEYERALVQVKRGENRDSADRVLRGAALMLGAAGAGTFLVGLVAGLWWSKAALLWQLGLAILVVAAAAFGAALARFSELGIRLLGGEAAGAIAGDLDRTQGLKSAGLGTQNSTNPADSAFTPLAC
jgi:hypothetical protein